MDFYNIVEVENEKKARVEIFPDFQVKRTNDLMVRAKSFYAMWDEETNLWSTDEYKVQQLVDSELEAYRDRAAAAAPEKKFSIRYLGNFSSSTWLQFRNYLSHISDDSVQLDENLTFSNTEVKKSDHVSRRLSYPLAEGDISAYDELMGVLYAPDERAKIEWAIGAIVAGDSKNIQKFLVLYGAAGTGKSTVLNIIQKLFEGYFVTFEAKALTSANNAFSTEAFKDNPLVAIQHDGDLSRIEDNTKLNSIISHEEMTMNEKYKPSYTSRSNAFLFMGTNKPVKITDAKSGIIRRLIDVQPTGEKLAPRRYQALYSQIDFELGAIAFHCLETYRSMGKDYYSGYRPVEMMLQTDVFFNFIEQNFQLFTDQGGVTLKQAYTLYKDYCEETGIEWQMPRYKLREELKNYFGEFTERLEKDDGTFLNSWYSEFKADQFKSVSKKDEPGVFSLVMDNDESLFDRDMFSRPAQYATSSGTPMEPWASVTQTLADLDTTKLHYVKPPLNHIVIDFDLTDASGEKSAERNMEAASQWPPTYSEFSKSGAGVHLHYLYDGDTTELSRIYDDGIEVKVFTGDASLRRMLTKCNNVGIAKISSGLPLKERKTVIDQQMIKSEKALRDLIGRNLRKEIHDSTKSSMDFIYQILEDTYASGLSYDITDMRAKIMAFANNSTHQSVACLKLMQTMKFANIVEPLDDDGHAVECKCENCQAVTDNRLVFFDVESYPNLFVVCWKYQGDSQVVKMINPKSQDIEPLLTMKLVGFNCRNYDNSMILAAFMGYSVKELYQLSQRIINNAPNAILGDSYGISHADIFDISSKRQSLKKWEIELGIPHVEMDIPWDQPVPDDKIEQVAAYCANDVQATEVVWDNRKQDVIARQILADLSGLTINASTLMHVSRIIFGMERNPQKLFTEPDLKVMFPGYEYSFGKSIYLGEEIGEGGLVRSKPGIYHNVTVFDVASMHPTSIEQLNLFGPYTEKYSELKKARIAIKHGDYDEARKMLDGKLIPYLTDPEGANELANALKLVLNSTYGFTSARFSNPFRDPRNVENWVAKRGSLFMMNLIHEVEARGFPVIHTKTDSIKVADVTPEITKFIFDYGLEFGYNFEVENVYERICLVNDAVYIAKTSDGKWTATGTQFAVPYVFKKLFSHEEIVFADLCETKSVQTAIWIDFTGVDTPMALENNGLHFIGKVGQFTPVTQGGGKLVREKEGTYTAAVTGTKDHRWLESNMVKTLKLEEFIDYSYYNSLVDNALAQIAKFGDSESFCE